MTRPDARANDELRPVAWELGYQEWAHGSVLLSMGKTRVLIAAVAEGDGEGMGHRRVLHAPRLDERTIAA